MYKAGAKSRHLIPATCAGINNTIFQLASLSECCVIRGILPEQGRMTLQSVGSSPWIVTACHCFLQPTWLPTLHPMAECVLTFQCWATEPAHVQCNWPLFSSAHWKTVQLGICLGTWAPCCQHQYCVHLMEVPGVCLCDLGTPRKPEGLATNKESLSPLCRTQLAPLRDNLTSSIFSNAKLAKCCSSE